MNDFMTLAVIPIQRERMEKETPDDVTRTEGEDTDVTTAVENKLQDIDEKRRARLQQKHNITKQNNKE